MKLEKAIEILSDYVYEDKPCPIGLYDEATRLSIEALKRCLLQRKHLYPDGQPLFLGETEE